MYICNIRRFVCKKAQALSPDFLFFKEGDYPCLSRYHVKEKKKALLFNGYHYSILSFVQMWGDSFQGSLNREKVKSQV